MKQELITPKQFVDLPLSQAVRQVIFDVQQFDKQGVCINMDSWITTDTKNKVCQVCLGGAALASFKGINNSDYLSSEINGCSYKNWEKIKLTFNSIQLTQYAEAYSIWYSLKSTFWNTTAILYSSFSNLWFNHTSFHCKLDSKELKQLYKQMNEFADLLEKHGR